MDGPFVLEAADLPENLRQFSESLAENAVLSGSAPEAETNLDPALTPRGWWKTNAERTISVGLAETLITLRDYLKGHEFDASDSPTSHCLLTYTVDRECLGSGEPADEDRRLEPMLSHLQAKELPWLAYSPLWYVFATCVD